MKGNIELYRAFSNPSANLPLHTSLHGVQRRQGFGGAGKERNPISDEACGDIFGEGEHYHTNRRGSLLLCMQPGGTSLSPTMHASTQPYGRDIDLDQFCTRMCFPMDVVHVG